MLDGDPEKEILVELRLKDNSTLELETVAKDFFNELLNYAFYEEQSRKNVELRNTLLKTALLTNIGAEEEECESCKESENEEVVDWSDIEDLEDDEFEDPDGIATPWEEKYGGDEQTNEADEEQGNKLPKETLDKEKEFTEAMSCCTDDKLGGAEDFSKTVEIEATFFSEEQNKDIVNKDNEDRLKEAG